MVKNRTFLALSSLCVLLLLSCSQEKPSSSLGGPFQNGLADQPTSLLRGWCFEAGGERIDVRAVSYDVDYSKTYAEIKMAPGLDPGIYDVVETTEENLLIYESVGASLTIDLDSESEYRYEGTLEVTETGDTYPVTCRLGS